VLHREIRAASGAVIRPLTSKHDTADGLNPHGVIVDEVHAMDWGMLGVLDTACGSRNRALIFQITTAGELSGAGHMQYQYACKILDGTLTDDTFFPVVFELDKDAEVREESAWVKANPNIGISVSVEYIREQVHKIGASPLDKANVLTKHFNRWQSANADFAAAEDIAACLDMKLTLADAKGYEILAAVDYCSTFDCASVGFFWLDREGLFCTFQRHFIPSETVKSQKSVPWQAWLDGGTLEIIDGKIVDPKALIKWVVENAAALGVKNLEVAYDKYQFNQAAADLKTAGCSPIPYGQRRTFMNEPCKTLARYISQHRMRFNDVALACMLGNVQLVPDKAGLVQPVKADIDRKIDGAIISIMALARIAEHAREAAAKAAEKAAKYARLHRLLGIKQ
jgi:phage terminase large subunit-like protein